MPFHDGFKVGIISDTHNQIERTRVAVELLKDRGAELLIHCGDFTNAEVVAACATLPLYFVFGNNDCDSDLEWAAEQAGSHCLGWSGEIEVGEKRIAVTHGHLTGEIRQLLAAQPHYLLTGHSHVVGDRQEGSTRCINPGALFRARDYTVALLDVGTDDVQFLEIPR